MERALLQILTSVALAVTHTAKRFDLERSSAADLGAGGDLRHLRPGSTRLLRYEDLLLRPQQIYTAIDRSPLALKTKICCVPLETPARVMGELGAETVMRVSFKHSDRVKSRVESKE
jgi:hypothetical protein